jgi:predicted transcriptional regulator of viral defense system
MQSSLFNSIFEIAQEQHGLVRVEDLRQAGIDPFTLVNYKRRGQAEQVAHGLYKICILEGDPLAEYMQATLWPAGKGYLSHETALDLWELCDINPNYIHVSVPKKYRTHRVVPNLYKFHKEEIKESEKTFFEGVPIVKPEIAIQQTTKNKIRPSLIRQAAEAAKNKALISNRNLEEIQKLFKETYGQDL